MFKAIYSLGRINRYINLKFSIVIRNSKGSDSIKRSSFNGNQYLTVSGLYPTITIELLDEIKDGSTPIWSTNKVISFGKFQVKMFVSRGRDLLKKFVTLKDLFSYNENVLEVNKELSWKNREVFQTDYGKSVLLFANVVEDEETHQQYEGVVICINELSNYGKLTYEEFQFLIDYLDQFNYDMLALQLLSLVRPVDYSGSLHTTIVKPEENLDITKENDIVTEKERVSQQEESNITWRKVENTQLIPEI